MIAASRTARDELPPARNRRATASLLLGLLAVAAVPAGIVLSRFTEQVSLVEGCASALVAGVLGVAALSQARRGRERAQLTLGRSGGERTARAGRALGLVALWIALTTGLALAFYALLTLFAG